MKRFSCSILMMMAITYGFCQNKEPKFLIEEIEVTDTAKAMAMAEQRREELKNGIKADQKIVNDELFLLQYISGHKKKTIKKEKDISMMLDILDRCANIAKDWGETDDQVLFNSNIRENLKQGIVDPIFFDGSEITNISRFLLSSVLDERKIDNMPIEKLVNPLPTKKITVKKRNPNFAYSWISKINKKSLSYNPLKDVYTSADYPQYIFKECSCDSYKSVKFFAMFDKSDNIVSSQIGINLDDVRNDIIDACCWYDYQHNAYGINEENANLKKCVESILKGEVPINDGYIVGAALQSSMIRSMARQSLKYRSLTLAEYNEVIKGSDAALKKRQMEIEKIMKQYSEETITKARRYVQTLKDYNSNFIHSGYGYERDDALEAVITFNKLSIKQIFSYIKDGNKLTCDYKVINKEIPN